MSLRARLLNQWLRRVEKPAMEKATDPAVLRRRFDAQARLFFHAPRKTRMQWQTLQVADRQIDALEVVPTTRNGDAVILYLHGGAFVFGSPRAYAAMVGQIAHRLGARAVLPRYRLAPEAPFPAARDDVRAAWDALIASGVNAANIIIGGDSAGGCLALGLLAQLCADNAEMPAGVFCFSPLTDMTHQSDSFARNAKAEAVLPATRAAEMGQMYLNGVPLDDPRVSPLFAQFDRAAPVWLSVGDTEILYDDACAMAAHLEKSGVPVTLRQEHDLPHVWPLFHNTVPEARQTLDDLAAWIRQQPGWPAES